MFDGLADGELAAAGFIVGGDGLDGLPLALEQAAAYCRESIPLVTFN
jgi:hypothetical protein